MPHLFDRNLFTTFPENLKKALSEYTADSSPLRNFSNFFTFLSPPILITQMRELQISDPNSANYNEITDAVLAESPNNLGAPFEVFFKKMISVVENQLLKKLLNISDASFEKHPYKGEGLYELLKLNANGRITESTLGAIEDALVALEEAGMLNQENVSLVLNHPTKSFETANILINLGQASPPVLTQDNIINLKSIMDDNEVETINEMLEQLKKAGLVNQGNFDKIMNLPSIGMLNAINHLAQADPSLLTQANFNKLMLNPYLGSSHLKDIWKTLPTPVLSQQVFDTIIHHTQAACHGDRGSVQQYIKQLTSPPSLSDDDMVEEMPVETQEYFEEIRSRTENSPRVDRNISLSARKFMENNGRKINIEGLAPDEALEGFMQEIKSYFQTLASTNKDSWLVEKYKVVGQSLDRITAPEFNWVDPSSQVSFRGCD